MIRTGNYEMQACSNCKTRFDALSPTQYSICVDAGLEYAELCSPSCLVEWAWKLKEGQPKLSKSYPAGYHPAEFEK